MDQYRIILTNQVGADWTADLTVGPATPGVTLRTLPQTDANIARLRRIAESYAGHELDWYGGRGAPAKFDGARRILWWAKAVDAYVPDAT
jgi:hypothetical protein